MFASGYTNESINDDGKCRFVTEFEKNLPLRHISLLEYEERLKKDVFQSMEGKAPVDLIVKNFKDHWAFKDIEVP